MLTSGGPEVTKEQRLGLEIVHVCFVEVGDSVTCIYRRLMPGVFASEAARQVTCFLVR